MESLLHTSSAAYLSPRLTNLKLGNQNSTLNLSKWFSSSSFSCNLRHGRQSLFIRVEAKKKDKSDKEDTHSFVPRPDEATGPFPEAVLLKEKKVQEDGRLLPEFADAEEQELYEFLDLQLQSQLNVELMRHYEVVYLIHEKHAEELTSVNEKVQGQLLLVCCVRIFRDTEVA
ncbi:uncharacterized protein LOC110821442 [Carica papaya]|uniref:uncharacterized protein LOC110821442 n=1 Tax=Carica papaya TaxID=3649 RepID=UPI000B8D0751|nr:uncharacterized protein LOC110821442 [Carica papaya]